MDAQTAARFGSTDPCWQ